MRKIRIFEHISLDGVISPDKRNETDDDFANGGWSAPYRSAAGVAALAEAQGSSFDLLLGRRTYDLWADHWPKITTGPFAKALNAATKFVATHRPGNLTWGPAQDLGPDIMACVRRVKSQDGPDLIVWGSSTLTSVLLEQGLVDEVVLIVYPVLLGPGKRFFSESADPRELALLQHKGHAHRRAHQHISTRWIASKPDRPARLSGTHRVPLPRVTRHQLNFSVFFAKNSTCFDLPLAKR